MKSITFYGFAALLAAVVHGLPQATRAASDSAIVIPPPLPAVAPSPYPASPTTNEFKYLNFREKNDDDKKHRKLVHDAFQDFSPVLKAAIECLDDQDDSDNKAAFDRWFPDKVLREDKDDLVGSDYVKGVLSQAYSFTDDAPTEAVAGFVCYRNDWKNSCKEGTRAYTVAPGFHFCSLGLEQTTKASDVKCQDLGDAISEKMTSMTGILIHEFMHQIKIGDKAPNSVGHIGDSYYSAASCQRYRQGAKQNKTFNNADSYKWFALNAYYNKVCDKKFEDAAVTVEDFEAGQLELLSSNDYNEADSIGGLAGV